jgi:hypothetical protein
MNEFYLCDLMTRVEHGLGTGDASGDFTRKVRFD